MSYPIEVICVGESDCYDDIVTAIDLLNDVQREFYFTVPPPRLQKSGWDLLPRDEHGYHTADVFAFLAKYKQDARGYRPFLIAVVGDKLRSDKLGNLFGSHEAKDGYAVISMKDLERFSPSRLRYLCYYLIRYALSFVNPNIKGHTASRSCIFDRKLDKRELVMSLETGHICPEHRGQLTRRLSLEENLAIQEMVKVLKDPAQQYAADIAIITLVTEETRAVLNGLKQHGELHETIGKHTVRYFYEGQLPAAKGGFHRVVCTQSTKQGNRPVATAYTHITGEYSPKLVVLLGIAGGIHKAIDVCDAMIADSILYYDNRKETNVGTKHRGQAYEIPRWLLPELNHFFVKYGEPAIFDAAEGSAHTQFRVFKGPIGSGEAVVADQEAEIRKWLTGVNDKTLSVETEAGGLAEVFSEETLRRGYQADGYLVVRGISDHADREKNDAWRQASANNAMIALSHFLAGIQPVGGGAR